MEDRKTQILKLSNELVQKYGYDSFSYADLSKQLGITKASIHHHFPKKDDLGLAVCKYIHEYMKKELENISFSEKSALLKLEDYFDLYANIISEGDKICPIASFQAEANVISKEMREEVSLIDDMEVLFLEMLLQEGQKNGELNIYGSLKVEAILMASTLKGALQFARIHGKEYYHEVSQQLVLRIKN